jgi:probable F420-dependent oxidoreductase
MTSAAYDRSGGRDGGRLSVRVGVRVPNAGPLPAEVGIPSLARAAESAGFASLWVSDHIVMPASFASRYPFAADGRATWASDTPYVDALVALALVAAVTESATIGTAVLVLPLRHPVVAAKQLASIDVASGGRLRLGVGAGWLREEFEALEVPYEGRGSRLDEWLSLLRDCWTGTPPARVGKHYSLPAGVLCYPTPAHEIPFLVGGHSQAALRRAGRLGDGWLAQQSLDGLDTAELGAAAGVMRAAALEAGRDADALEVVLRIVDSAARSEEVARQLPALARAGVDEVIVDFTADVDLAADYERMAAAVA